MCRPLVWSHMHTGRSCDTCRAAVPVPVPVLLQLHPECVDGAHPQQAVAARDGATASPLAGLPPFSPPSCHPPACPVAAAAPTCIHVHMWRGLAVLLFEAIEEQSRQEMYDFAVAETPSRFVSISKRITEIQRTQTNGFMLGILRYPPTELFLKYKGGSTSAQFHW